MTECEEFFGRRGVVFEEGQIDDVRVDPAIPTAERLPDNFEELSEADQIDAIQKVQAPLRWKVNQWRALQTPAKEPEPAYRIVDHTSMLYRPTSGWPAAPKEYGRKPVTMTVTLELPVHAAETLRNLLENWVYSEDDPACALLQGILDQLEAEDDGDWGDDW